MKRTLAVVALAVTCWSPVPTSADTRYSYVGHKKYISKIHPADVDEGPTWDIKTQACPPLSAGTAVEAAKKVLAGLFPDASKWSVNAITLSPHGPGAYWYYEVSFIKLAPTIESGGAVPTLSLAVLMSGKAVQPEVVDWDGEYDAPSH
jgi:hypothetical protein